MSGEETEPAPGWSTNPDVLERIFMAAVGEGDADGVEAAIRLLLVVDSRRAVELWESLRRGLHVLDLIDLANGDASVEQIRRLVS